MDMHPHQDDGNERKMQKIFGIALNLSIPLNMGAG